MKEQLIAAGKSYARASLASVAALYMSGITDPKVLANAFVRQERMDAKIDKIYEILLETRLAR